MSIKTILLKAGSCLFLTLAVSAIILAVVQFILGDTALDTSFKAGSIAGAMAILLSFIPLVGLDQDIRIILRRRRRS